MAEVASQPPGTPNGGAAMAGAAAAQLATPPSALQGRSGDALDSPDFDAVKFLNEMFPTEASLVGLDPLITTLRAKIRRVDAEILDAVRQQSANGGCSRQDLVQAKQGIGELFGRVADIKRKAEASEAMVQEICRDIRKLDHAKANLTATITAFRRLSMLVTAVDQLQRAVERNEYGEAAHLIEAVQQLAGHFQSFVAIPKVAELSGRVATLQRAVQANAMREFELLGPNEDKPNPLLLERLRACCQVVNALGYKARDDLTDAMCKKEMGVYTAIFGTTGDTAALERTDRRYLWLRKRLGSRQEVWGIFPPEWHLPQLVCLAFCTITKSHLAEILDAKAAELPSQVEALLRAVNTTNDFENELAARFGDASPAEDEDGDGDGPPADDVMSASGVRSRYERLFRERQAAAAAQQDDGSGGPGEEAPGAGAVPVRTPFQGAISTIFTKHLSYYVEAQERELLGTLEALLAEETWRPADEAAGGVLRSASQLFGEIKKSLVRCSKYITRGPALLQLMATFQRVAQAYTARLTGRLPRTAAGAPLGATPSLATQEWHVRLGDGDVAACCAVVTTAEYCTEVIGALARNVAKLLDPPLGDEVDVSEEEEGFAGVATAALNALLLGLETRLDACLGSLMRCNWAATESVGDQSDFVTAMGRTLQEFGPPLGAALPEHHFAFLCDKLASSFLRRFGEAVSRCRKIGEAGSQQLLLDTHAVRSLLLGFPASGRPGEPAPAMFRASVTRELSRVEALLKVVGSRPDTLLHNFATLLPGATSSDFQRIVELKVLKKSEASALLEAYNRQIGRAGQPTAAGGTLLAGSAVAGEGRGGGGNAAGGPGLLPHVATGGPGAGAPFGGGPGSAAATARVQASTQELASRFRSNANTAAQRAQAAAGSATDRMRESFASMRMLSFGMGRERQQEAGGRKQQGRR